MEGRLAEPVIRRVPVFHQGIHRFTDIVGKIREHPILPEGPESRCGYDRNAEKKKKDPYEAGREIREKKPCHSGAEGQSEKESTAKSCMACLFHMAVPIQTYPMPRTVLMYVWVSSSILALRRLIVTVSA